MSLQDAGSEIDVGVGLNTTAVSGSGATAGAIVDCAGYRGIEFVLQSGTLTDGSYTPSLAESDASDMSGSNAVATGDLVGTIAAATFAASDDNAVKKLGYVGSKRYVQLTITAASVTTGGTIGAVVLKSGKTHST